MTDTPLSEVIIQSTRVTSTGTSAETHVEAKPVDALQLQRVTVHANDLGPQQPDGLLSRLRTAVATACCAREGGAAHIDQDALAAVLKD